MIKGGLIVGIKMATILFQFSIGIILSYGAISILTFCTSIGWLVTNEDDAGRWIIATLFITPSTTSLMGFALARYLRHFQKKWWIFLVAGISLGIGWSMTESPPNIKIVLALAFMNAFTLTIWISIAFLIRKIRATCR